MGSSFQHNKRYTWPADADLFAGAMGMKCENNTTKVSPYRNPTNISGVH